MRRLPTSASCCCFGGIGELFISQRHISHLAVPHRVTIVILSHSLHNIISLFLVDGGDWKIGWMPYLWVQPHKVNVISWTSSWPLWYNLEVTFSRSIKSFSDPDHTFRVNVKDFQLSLRNLLRRNMSGLSYTWRSPFVR